VHVCHVVSVWPKYSGREMLLRSQRGRWDANVYSSKLLHISACQDMYIYTYIHTLSVAIFAQQRFLHQSFGVRNNKPHDIFKNNCNSQKWTDPLDNAKSPLGPKVVYLRLCKSMMYICDVLVRRLRFYNFGVSRESTHSRPWPRCYSAL